MSEDQGKPKPGKGLLSYLRANGLDEYGSVISGDNVRAAIGIEYPEVATKREFDALAMIELSAVDYVRQVLLHEGKFLQQKDGDYRILLPSENSRQIEQYMQHADNKLRRAYRLSKNTPKTDTYQPDNTAARIFLKRESIKQRTEIDK